MVNQLNLVEPESVLEVLSCKWTLLVLERLAEGTTRPGRVQRAIPGLSAKVLYDRLHRLEQLGLIESQAFDGYPRRAEYRLTPGGQQVCQAILAWREAGLSLQVISEVMKCRWLTDMVQVLGDGPQRPSQIKRRLGEISSKVLAEKLRKLEALGLIDRQVGPERPLAVWYQLSQEGEKLSPALGAFRQTLSRPNDQE